MLSSLSFHTCFILAFVHIFTMLLPWGLSLYKLVEYGRISSVCSLLRIHRILLGFYSEHWLDAWDKLFRELSSCLLEPEYIELKCHTWLYPCDIQRRNTNYNMSICYDQSFFCNLVLCLNMPFSSGRGAGVSAAAAAGNTSSWFINGQYSFFSFFTLKNLILIQQSSSIPLSRQSSSSSPLKLSPSIPLSWQWSLSSSSLRVLWYCRDLIHAGWHFIFVTHVILY